MSIPAELQNKKLLDSRWRRRVGKHKGVQCKIIKTNGSGVVLEFDTRNRHGWQGHGENSERTNLPWEMFLRLYEPIGVIMENVPNVKVDTSGIVIAKVGDASYMEKKAPSPSFRQCNGPSHHVRPASVDVGKFGYTERLYNGTRRLRSECDDCVRYRNEHYRSKEKEEQKLLRAAVDLTEGRRKRNGNFYRAAVDLTDKVLTEEVVEPKPTTQAVDGVTITRNIVWDVEPAPKMLPNWKVTVVERVEHLIYADNYLEAADGFDRPGVEIVKIEKVS